jgi:hypothetical protein
MIRPIEPDAFSDWCADTLLREEGRFLSALPADQYWPAIDEAAQINDRLEAALSRKVQINAA